MTQSSRAVGVDIACRMKLTVLDLPVNALADDQTRLTGALERETRFGMGASFRSRRQHDVMDADWRVTSVTSKLKDRAWAQLGTSGSGNHFVEFGQLTVLDDAAGLSRGEYFALLSHSGSRGTGAQIAQYYSQLARELHPELPQELSHLAWLDLSTEAGQEYWAAMELMGRYAAANHALIHAYLARALGIEVLLDIENHHNFAWRERHRLVSGSFAPSGLATQPLARREAGDSELPHEMLRVPTDKRAQSRCMLTHDEGDLGVFQRHPFLHSGQQFLRGWSRKSRFIVAARHDRHAISAGKMHVQRMKRSSREIEAENAADLQDVDHAGDATAVPGQPVECAAIHSIVDVGRIPEVDDE